MNQEYIHQLEKLAALREKGILTEDEFNTRKLQLLKHQDLHSTLTQVTTSKNESEGTYWLPIPSLILGILCILCLFDDSDWGNDQITGLFLFASIGLVLGIIGVATQNKGKGMSIAGIVMSSIGLLAWLGMP